MSELKLYTVVSPTAVRLMGGNRGKLSAQTAHGYLHAWWDAAERFPEVAHRYRFDQAAPKVTLTLPIGETEVDQLQKLYEAYRTRCGVAFVRDAGRTVFKEPTVTCIGIGPIMLGDCGEDLRSLRPLI